VSAKVVMVQGTTSNAGKSVLATALCKLFADKGLRTAPFKSWNMSLNSYVTGDGLEIARSQGIQAEAAGVEATGDMNPFLLKPEGKRRTQVIVRGRALKDNVFQDVRNRGIKFADYALPIIEESLRRVMAYHDVVVIEGAGSPVELNIKESDVANMRVARLVDAPVAIVADIDRGGALAGVVGTIDLFPPSERRLVIGSILNKFRGDYNILKPGLDIIEAETQLPVIGVIPYLQHTGVGEEDSVSLGKEPPAPDPEALENLAQVVEQSLDMAYICRKMGLEAIEWGKR